MPDLIQMLASNMVNRKVAGREPYVLVLGAGASLTSGCSSYSELVDDFLRQFCAGDLAALNEEQDERTREEAKRDRFYQEWRRMGGVNRYAFLCKHLGGNPSPGYEHLAWLAHHGYLRLIFSTNLDNHVERAFTAAGLAPNQHYEPLTNALGKEAKITRRLEAPTPPVKLVKLHGTLSDEDSYAWLPGEVFAFEDELDDALRMHLNKDVIILGHRMDDRDLNLPFRAKGGEIWFVNPGGARDTDFKAVLDARAQSRSVMGEAARFDDFLAALRTQIEGIESGAEARQDEPAIHRFLRAIGLPGQIGEQRSRYLHLPELYVKPEEYDKIRATLDKHHAVVIAGEPHMGKTYTALHLLWERFQQGWTVVHMKRDTLAGVLQQCGHLMDEFASRHLAEKCLLHLDDPFGETEYQPLGPLQRDLSGLVHEVRRRGCALILTSRIGIFNEAMGHLEGAALFREMGVEADIRVHTSYSEETRREVLTRYLALYEPAWAGDEALRETALAQVPRILEAPHNLELFARRSEGISQGAELLDFARSCREMIPALADWIARLPAEDQLVLVMTDSFDWRDLTALGAFHRRVLARAYQEGLIEHIAGTAWDSALDRLRDIVTVRESGEPVGPALSFVHPSYSEALLRALGASSGLPAVWLVAMAVASRGDDPGWRAAAAGALVRNYEKLDGEGRKLLASLAADEAEGVRRSVVSPLARNYEKLDREGRELLASLAVDEAAEVRQWVAAWLVCDYENPDGESRELLASLAADEAEGVRGEVASSLAHNYEKLDGKGRELLASLATDEAAGVRARMAASLGRNYGNLDGEGWKLLASLAADEAKRVRRQAAWSLGCNYGNLDGEGWKLLASLATDRAKGVREQVAFQLGSNYEKLDAEGRELLASLAADRAKVVRGRMAYSLARNYEKLDAKGRELLASLAADRAKAVRGRMASSLAQNYEKLDAKGRELLASLAADGSKPIRYWLADGLVRHHEHLDAEGRRLLEQVRSSLAEE